MQEISDVSKIYEALIELKKEVDFIKNHMIDIDVVLTQGENVELVESLNDLKAGKVFSLEDIKNDRENV